MNLLDFKNIIIPGYQLLSESQQLIFEQSKTGREFSTLANNQLSAYSTIPLAKYLLESLFTGSSLEKKQLLEELEYKKKKFLQKYKQSPEYQTLLEQISFILLKTYMPDFELLSPDTKELLAKATYSKELHLKYVSDTSFWSKALNSLAQNISKQQEDFLTEWQVQFLKQPYSNEILEEINQQKILIKKQEINKKRTVLTDRANQLALFFPLLNTAASSEAIPLSQLIDSFESHIESEQFDYRGLEEQCVADTILPYLQKASKNLPSTMSPEELKAFNEQEAYTIAQGIINAFDSDSTLKIDTFLNDYKSNLLIYTQDKLLRVHGKKRQPQTYAVGNLTNALSNLVWNSEVATQSAHFVRQLAESRAFYVYTGFAAQGDNLINTVFELHNINRIKEEVAETRSIFAKILSPFKPVYDEFKDIYLNETQSYSIFFRTLVPLAIIVGFIIGITVLLSPLVIPEVITAVIIIPTLLFIGMALASAYVTIKDDVYNYCRNWYYGGPFEIPEFQINDRMERSFHTKEKAQIIRTFYVHELKKCDQIAADYLLLEKEGIISTAQLASRQENAKRRCDLYLEWYDIHSNFNLGFDDTPKIILNRLAMDLDKEFQLMEETWNTTDTNLIKESIDSSVENIKTTLAYDSNLDITPNTTVVTPSIKHAIRFFKPKCLDHRATAEQLDTLIVQFSS